MSLPAYVLYRGKRVRVTGYDSDYFRILLSDDSQTEVHRRHITFIKRKKEKI